MTNTPTSLTYTLEDILTRFEQKMDRQFTEVNQKLEKIDDRFNRLEIGQAELSGEIKALDQKLSGEIKTLDEKLSGEIKTLDEKLTGEIKALDQKLSGEIKTLDEKLSGEIKTLDEKLSGEIKTLDEKLSGEIKTLDQKVSGVGKRLDNQEFINRGILVSVIIALLGGAAKLFDIIPLTKN